jgi:hypothetical protein
MYDLEMEAEAGAFVPVGECARIMRTSERHVERLVRARVLASRRVGPTLLVRPLPIPECADAMGIGVDQVKRLIAAGVLYTRWSRSGTLVQPVT